VEADVSDLVFVKVYRVSEVFETEVDEAELGEEEDLPGRPALREALRRVRDGALEGGPPDAEFVALAWGETAQVTAAALLGSAKNEDSCDRWRRLRGLPSRR
jgi:hypothetical protein